MNRRDISTSSDPDMAATPAAMLAAVRMAEDLAIRTNTAIVVTIDGKLVRITAEELRAKRLREVAPGACAQTDGTVLGRIQAGPLTD